MRTIPTMLAIRALPIIVPPSPAPERSRHPILTSIQPALDTAFGLEPAVLFPERIAELLAALTAALDGIPAEPALAEFDFLQAA